jgi:diguanylate cyclase
MGAAKFQGLEVTSAQKLLCLLDSLRQSPTGAVVYRQVERMLEDLLGSHQDIEHAYLTLINRLLEAYASQLRPGSSMQVQVRLLQTRLRPPLTVTDMETLRDYVEVYADQIEAAKELDNELFDRAIEPLLSSFGIIEKAPGAGAAAEATVVSEIVTPAATAEVEAAAIPPEPEAVTAAAETITEPTAAAGSESDFPASGEFPPQAAEYPEREHPLTGRGTGTPISGESEAEEGSDEGAEAQVDTAYRSHLDSKRRDIQKLQSTLGQQVLDTIAQNEEFGVLLEVVLGELRQAGDGRELEDLRWTLIREIEKLTKGHHELAEQLDSTHHYLQLIETDSRQLSDELTRVRLLSLTDELTGLPNRRAFLRRIEDEVARVQRYGFPLSLALIDLDHFKQINDKHGHAGGDEVLQIYSKNILSIFRHHDLVARYGGEEFAVLLPNTDAEGALRALTKVKNRAAETRWQANGEMIPVPTFSSGVSLYKPGETASGFIERADKALYRAKRLGRNRVEMDATYKNESEAETTAAAGDENIYTPT